MRGITWRGNTKRRSFRKRSWSLRTRSRKRSSSTAIAAPLFGVISGIRIHRRWKLAADRNYDVVENRDCICRENLGAIPAESNVGNEVELAITAPCVKFQYRIRREVATADIEHTVCTEHAGLEYVCVSAGVIECD